MTLTATLGTVATIFTFGLAAPLAGWRASKYFIWLLDAVYFRLFLASKQSYDKYICIISNEVNCTGKLKLLLLVSSQFNETMAPNQPLHSALSFENHKLYKLENHNNPLTS